MSVDTPARHVVRVRPVMWRRYVATLPARLPHRNVRDGRWVPNAGAYGLSPAERRVADEVAAAADEHGVMAAGTIRLGARAGVAPGPAWDALQRLRALHLLLPVADQLRPQGFLLVLPVDRKTRRRGVEPGACRPRTTGKWRSHQPDLRGRLGRMATSWDELRNLLAHAKPVTEDPYVDARHVLTEHGRLVHMASSATRTHCGRMVFADADSRDVAERRRCEKCYRVTFRPTPA